MSAIRILHVDDEPDIREIVEMSLGLHADFEVRACANGADAIAAAAEWSPSLILLDVMMPGMDGPMTLTHLRNNPRTADIPVLFMTARAQARELQQFIAMGAQGVISKPFDPMTLAFSVRSHLQAIRLESLRAVFVRRAKGDAAVLASCRSALRREAGPAVASRIREIAHGLAGAAGLFGFDQISSDAAALEEVVVARLGGGGTSQDLTRALDDLMSRLEGGWDTPRTKRAQSAQA
ncbi:MAG TPA: response regulator [Xanthobacteraceae bacterium]|nr:response regulator [Xanthobacteraceae bacterium]